MAEHGSAPERESDSLNGTSVAPSVERAIKGDYRLYVGEVVKEAWGRVGGNKGTIWLAMLLYMVAIMVLSGVTSIFTGGAGEPNPDPGLIDLLGQLVATLLTVPMWVGISFLGVAIASGRSVKPASIVGWYSKTFKLFFTYFLMGLMILLGTMLLVLPGIYLMIAYQMALLLVLDKDMSPWEAMETSRKAITHKWFSFFGLWVIVAVLMMVSMMLIGIPLIWLLPAFVIGSGILYRNMFGAQESSLEKVED